MLTHFVVSPKALLPTGVFVYFLRWDCAKAHHIGVSNALDIVNYYGVRPSASIFNFALSSHFISIYHYYLEETEKSAGVLKKNNEGKKDHAPIESGV
ncbi:hypothetical protein CUC15_17370 [Oceanobacillus zhaokaii]|uniref:Uncharacterized protein n=1 Tax=Oceanobacillus zhaokaii TaxID=2052660 RepID=A0A345PKR7_9BACI|nr:hypothetical protein CUC15_17370 [Oceanobacillus zhaokaii]